MTVTRDHPIKLDTVDEYVNVFVISVCVPRDEVLIPIQAHAIQVALADLDPFGIGQVFAWCRR